MAAMTTQWAGMVLQHATGEAPMAFPTLWIALTTSTSSQAGIGTEASYPGYGRVSLATLLAAAANNSESSSGLIAFGIDTAGAPQNVTGWATFTAQAGGIGGWFGSCQLAVVPGVVPQFPVGALIFTLN